MHPHELTTNQVAGPGFAERGHYHNAYHNAVRVQGGSAGVRDRDRKKKPRDLRGFVGLPEKDSNLH